MYIGGTQKWQNGWIYLKERKNLFKIIHIKVTKDDNIIFRSNFGAEK